MDDETRRAFEDVRARIRWFAERHEGDWRAGADWRARWSAEMDALEAEVALLHAALRDLETRVSDVERSTTATADMVKAGLEGFARAVSANVRTIVNADRAAMLEELDAVKSALSAVALELGEIRREFAQHRQEVREGIEGLSVQLGQYGALAEKHERQLGDAT